MESILLQEFNLHKDPIPQVHNPTNNIVLENNIPKNISNTSPNLNKNNNNLINSNDVQKIKETISNSLNLQMQNNEFLQTTLDSEKLLLDSLIEDVEKVNRQINLVSEKNKQIKDEILEYRRKINMERDNLVKATSKLYAQTNELINNKGKLRYFYLLISNYLLI